MACYLLAWNPKRWHWENLAGFIDAFNSGEVSTDRWSCGRNKHITTGDRVWIIRLGEDPRDVFGHGTVITPSFEDVHWDDPAKVSQYVEYQLDSIVNPETDPIIPRVRLNDSPFNEMHWDTQMSGVQIPDNVAKALQEEWVRVNAGDGFALPEEIPPATTFVEGAKRIVSINSYERNSKARSACIAHYGPRCVVCGFTFSEKYGPVGDGLIHVHHLVPLAEIGEAYHLNPIQDLRPVGPNCHAIIHIRVPQYSIEDVKKMIGA